MEALQGWKTFSKSICAKEERNGLSSVNESHSRTQPCCLYPLVPTHLPLSRPFLLPENLSPKDIAGSDVRSWKFYAANAEEVWQEAGPDVIWRVADATWLHSFRVRTSHCLYLDHAYLYLRLYLRGTVHCLVNPKNWSLWWKLGGTTVKKA